MSQTLAPRSAAARLRRITPPAVTIAGLAALTAAVHVRDPNVRGSWGLCPFRLLTGWDCPGCGGLRAVHDLTHGHIVDALSNNLLVVVAVLPLGIAGLTWWFTAAWTGRDPRPDSATAIRWGIVAVVVLVAFAVVRNTPWGIWLQSSR